MRCAVALARSFAVAVLAAVMVTACAADDDADTPRAAPQAGEEPADTGDDADDADDSGPDDPGADDPGADDPGADEPDAGDPDQVTVDLEPVANLEAPVATAIRPGDDDTLYIAERAGVVRLLRNGDLVDEPLLDISDQTTTDGERGLLGLAFSADGDLLYVSHTDPEGTSRIAEYRLDGDVADPLSRRELLSVEQPYPNHNGGEITFGPDGMLYIGLGDGGSGGDPHDHGQNTGTLLGAMLRIDPAAGDPYAVPDDNPFSDGAGGEPEIWAYGLRNPWRFSFDRDTGDLWIADVGQSDREEINLMPAGEGGGANYGWNRLEGTMPFEGPEPDEHVLPVYEYENTGERCSVTGGRVYRGDAVDGLAGTYVYGDFCSGEVRGLAVSDGEVTAEWDLGPRVAALVNFGEDPAGELYTLSLDGDVSRVVP